MVALLLKLKGYGEVLLAVIVAIGGAFLWGKLKGDSATKIKDVEVQAKAVTKANQQQSQTRQEVDDAVSKLPKPTVPAPLPVANPSNAQSIGAADPGSAAGQLQNGWTGSD
jgi:hypothetical protein